MVSPTAQALGSLRDLEELLLPTGDGIQQVARLIVRQCLQLQRLRVLVFHHTLDDDSVMEIGEFPSGKGFPLCGSSGIIGAVCCKRLGWNSLPNSSSCHSQCFLSCPPASGSSWSDWQGQQPLFLERYRSPPPVVCFFSARN